MSKYDVNALNFCNRDRKSRYTFRPFWNWYTLHFFLSHSNSSRTNNPFVSSSITTQSLFLFFLWWLNCTHFARGNVKSHHCWYSRLAAWMSTDSQEPREFSSIRRPRFNPFSRVGGPFVVIESSRFDSPFLSFGSMINALAFSKYHSARKKGDDDGL